MITVILRSQYTNVPIMDKQEKKKAYNKIILRIENGTLTTLVCSIYGCMGMEHRTFCSRLSDLLSEKLELPKSVTMNWIWTKPCFALLSPAFSAEEVP